MILKILKYASFYIAGAYAIDVMIRPEIVAKRARRAANARGKPLLNVGCGTKGSSLRVFLLGHTGWGDVNCDVAAKASCDQSGKLACTCDTMHLPWKDKQFGAVIASHVLEHVEDPERALMELDRVADEVFVITPPWWAPHTYLHPGHRWFVSSTGQYLRLWS